MSNATKKPILCLDFDGVVHSYERGWQNGEIYGTLTPGFALWARHAKEHFQLVIYSSRSKTPEGIKAMVDWLAHQLDASEVAGIELAHFSFAHEKPPAFLTIDDRALRFDGYWSRFDPIELLSFRPYNWRSGVR